MSLLDLALLLCTAAMVLHQWFTPRTAHPGLVRSALLVLAALCIAQLWTEGFYWQFVPLYVILGLLIVARAGAATRTRGIRIAIATTLAAAMVVLAASWVFLPVPRLPAPTGPYAVGTSVFRWVTPDRDEPATADTSDRRNVIVQAWYPATAQHTASRIPYLDGSDRLPPTVAGLPRALFVHYDRIDTHAMADAAVNAERARWPVVIFSPGYGASRAFYTSLVTDLASRGVIVLAVDHAYEGAITQLVDARIVTPVEQLLPGENGRIGYMIRQTARRTADLRDVLDAVTGGATFGSLAPHMDTTRVAAIGHSFGGAAAVAIAGTDTRVRAAVNIDGTMYGTLPDQPLTRPFLLVESDRAETKHGAQFIEGHARLLARLGSLGHRCQLAKANHYSFTDAPLLVSAPARLAASLVFGGSRGPAATVRTTNDLVMRFLQESWSEDDATKAGARTDGAKAACH